jgi:hypothetical protein
MSQMSIGNLLTARTRSVRSALLFVLFGFCTFACGVQGQEDEIVANLAGGRVIIHVANERIIFAAIDQPLEAKSVPPRVVDLDSTHIGVLLGASEWQMPADPKPVRLDRNFQHIGAQDPRYQGLYSGQAEPDLEAIGISFLEKLRPLVSQLHHKLDLSHDEPLLEVIIIGYAPNNYGPEVWQVEFHIEQEMVATRGEYWQTRVLRPRFTQLYPPEGKHSPRTLVEVRFPEDVKGTPLVGMIQGSDPGIVRLRSSDPRFVKVLDNIEQGHAQKAAAVDSTDFLRAALPLIAGKANFVLGTIEQQRGFDWVVPPDEPVEKATDEDKNRPPDAPTLRKRPNQ